MTSSSSVNDAYAAQHKIIIQHVEVTELLVRTFTSRSRSLKNCDVVSLMLIEVHVLTGTHVITGKVSRYR